MGTWYVCELQGIADCMLYSRQRYTAAHTWYMKITITITMRHPLHPESPPQDNCRQSPTGTSPRMRWAKNYRRIRGALEARPHQRDTTSARFLLRATVGFTRGRVFYWSIRKKKTQCVGRARGGMRWQLITESFGVSEG